MRNLNKNENIKSLAEKENLPVKIVMLDVTDDRSVKNAMQSITAEANRIDVLVNNAGYGLIGAFEDLSMEEIKAQYETNLFGVIRVTQAVLPIMRKQKSGIIVNMSSVAGRFGFAGSSVFLVEPGAIRTNFFNGMVSAKKSQDPNSPYSNLCKMSLEALNIYWRVALLQML
jgi:NADP-dependent 3-hydroxy acid dehydrogenase YdfG